mmetsp:Transcript_108029/g.344964  ORF Transcript_108029/g.344964 Transcript_108029/m.344964 type:complete len:316 (-) Transcript_108029:1911-2858(-)
MLEALGAYLGTTRPIDMGGPAGSQPDRQARAARRRGGGGRAAEALGAGGGALGLGRGGRGRRLPGARGGGAAAPRGARRRGLWSAGRCFRGAQEARSAHRSAGGSAGGPAAFGGTAFVADRCALGGLGRGAPHALGLRGLLPGARVLLAAAAVVVVVVGRGRRRERRGGRGVPEALAPPRPLRQCPGPRNRDLDSLQLLLRSPCGRRGRRGRSRRRFRRICGLGGGCMLRRRGPDGQQPEEAAAETDDDLGARAGRRGPRRRHIRGLRQRQHRGAPRGLGEGRLRSVGREERGVDRGRQVEVVGAISRPLVGRSG